MPFERESPLYGNAAVPNDSAASTPDELNANWLTANLSTSTDVDYFKVVTSSSALIQIDESSQQVGSSSLWKLSLVDSNGDYITTLSSSVTGSPKVKTDATSTAVTLEVQGLTSNVPVGSRFTLVTSGVDSTIFTVVGATALSSGVSTLSLDKALGSLVSATTVLQFDPAQLALGGGSNQLVAKVDAAGTYFVKVEASTWTSADYQLRAMVMPTVETSGTASNENVAQASASNNRLLPNAWMTGSLSASSDVDTWVFTTATMPADLTVDFAAAGGDPVASKWKIQVQQLNANGLLVPVSTTTGSTLASQNDSPASSGSGTSATFSIQKAVTQYASPTTFVVTVSAVSSSAYSSSNYKLKLSGTSVDLNDTPVITVDTVTGRTPGAFIDTGVIRAIKASTTTSTSTLKINDLFTVTDADLGQTISSYRVQLTKASGETGSVSGKVVLDDGNGNFTDKGALGDAITLTAAEMAKARISVGTVTGNLALTLQALDSSNAPDGSGQSSVMAQTVRVVSAATGVNVSYSGSLALVEGKSDSSNDLSITLSSEPSANVDVYLEQSSENRLTFQSGNAAAGTSAKLTFTPSNYATPQTITVKAIDNATVEAPGHPALMSVRVVSSDAAYDGNNPGSLTFSLTDPVNSPPSGTLDITGLVNGKAVENQTTLGLNTSTLADADGLGTLSYQWQRNLDGGSTWVDISGAQTTVYKPGTADGGRSIRVEVRYVDGAGVAQSVLSSVVSVTNVNDSPTGTVTITGGTGTGGAPKVGDVLSAANTLADADGLGAITYTWKADGSAINGATNSSYTLTQAEVGKTLTVTASYTDLQGTPESVSSTATAAVAATGGTLSGLVYFWKSHVLLDKVSVTAADQSSSTTALPSVLTTSDGTFQFSSVPASNYGLSASRSTSDSSAGVTAADALAALRLAVGINPNPDPDGTGPLSPLKVSPYQLIAADVNQDGKVTAADALAILRMAVKLPTALPQEWFFVEETRDLWNKVAGQSALTRTSATWNHTISAQAPGSANLVGVLKGDVNGSWPAPSGAKDLDDLQPNHFTDLVQLIGAPLDQFGT